MKWWYDLCKKIKQNISYSFNFGINKRMFDGNCISGRHTDLTQPNYDVYGRYEIAIYD